MPSVGLSLVGFMEQRKGLHHLRSECIAPEASETALIASWQAAIARRGAPLPNAGRPDIRPLPAAHKDHVARLVNEPWAAPAFEGPLRSAEFVLVEIDPLLAFQQTINSDRAAHHCGTLRRPPALDELLPICLPLVPAAEDFTAIPGPSSLMIKSASLNLRLAAQGLFNESFVGIQFSVALPFISVARCEGRCYLHNGYNRAFGLRMAGATHIPCIIRDVPDTASAGVRADGSTFGAALLQSNDPPTLGHFTQGRALPVTLRSMSRILQVSWAEYAVPNE